MCQCFFSQRNIFPESWDQSNFGISVFHTYIHKWPCQVKYNPWYLKSWFLSDGDSLERLWYALSFQVSPLQKKLDQLPAVDMLKVQGSLWCYSNLSPILIQPSLDAQSLCTLHSDCAKKSTYANMWSLDGSLAGACWMSTAGSWSSYFFAVKCLSQELCGQNRVLLIMSQR